MAGGAALIGLVCVVFGGLGVVYPRKMARFHLRREAWGARNRGDLEPTEGYVTLTRVLGAVFAVVGVGFALGAV